MVEDLNMESHDYNIALFIFFIPCSYHFFYGFPSCSFRMFQNTTS